MYTTRNINTLSLNYELTFFRTDTSLNAIMQCCRYRIDSKDTDKMIRNIHFNIKCSNNITFFLNFRAKYLFIASNLVTKSCKQTWLSDKIGFTFINNIYNTPAGVFRFYPHLHPIWLREGWFSILYFFILFIQGLDFQRGQAITWWA